VNVYPAYFVYTYVYIGLSRRRTRLVFAHHESWSGWIIAAFVSRPYSATAPLPYRYSRSTLLLNGLINGYIRRASNPLCSCPAYLIYIVRTTGRRRWIHHFLLATTLSPRSRGVSFIQYVHCMCIYIYIYRAVLVRAAHT